MGTGGARQADGRDRERVIAQIGTSVATIGATVVAVPVVMAEWAPTWFVVAWACTYLIKSTIFLSLSFAAPAPWVRTGWSIGTAVLIAIIPISVIVWGRDSDTAPWIAATAAFVYMAFDVTALPAFRIDRWYTGTAIAGTAVFVMGWNTTGLVVALAPATIVIAMLTVGYRNDQLQTELDDRLAEAEAMVRADALTGLLNRRGFEDALRSSEGQEITVAVLDVDRFKLVNDAHGYEAGDRLLAALADHLKRCLSPDWTVARYGGDEFVALTHGRHQLPRSVTDALRVPLEHGVGVLSLSVTAGTATGVCFGLADRLMGEAGHALRYAKRHGQSSAESAGELRSSFERSFEVAQRPLADRVVPVAQVIVDNSGHRGFELLARWRSDHGDLLAPGEFMDTVVEHGLLAELDKTMLGHGIALARRLQDPEAFVSVNIAPSGLLDKGLPSRLRTLLDEAKVQPRQLMIEIIESPSVETGPRWEQAVAAIRDIGVLVAIDDFGAGYSNIERLQRLAITHLKVDRSLVTGSDHLHEVVAGVTRFCEAAAIEVIAEGVETTADLNVMRRAGITCFQGYLFAKPGPVDAIEHQVGAANEVLAAQVDLV